MTEENMKTYSISLYPKTHKEYMELKEEENLTHDEIIRELMKVYKERKKSE